jgi:phage terminase large subunit
LQNAGFDVKYHRSHPAIRDRINAVNSALCSSTGERKLVIDPKCSNVIKGLEGQTYKTGTQIPDKDSGLDHMNDAVGYGVEYILPVRKDAAPYVPRVWGHKIS